MGQLYILTVLGIMLAVVLSLATERHTKRQKTPAGTLLLGVVLPRRRAWQFGFDLLVVFVVVGSLCVLVAGRAGIGAFGLSTGSDETFFAVMALNVLTWRLLDQRRLFAPATLEIRERGVMFQIHVWIGAHQTHFWTWEQVKSYSWSDSANLMLTVRFAKEIGFFRIAMDQKDAVDRLFREKMAVSGKDVAHRRVAST